MFNQEARRNKRRASLQGANEAGEESLPIGAAEERIGSILGMRHQAEDSAGFVEDASDCMRRAVEIFGLRHLAIRSAIAEGDEPPLIEPVQRFGVGGVVAVVMCNRHPDHLTRFVPASKDRLVVLDALMDVATSETQ